MASGQAANPEGGAHVLGDGDAEGQRVFTAASRFCPAVLTAPSAVTTPDTVLLLGFAARLLTAVLRVARADCQCAGLGLPLAPCMVHEGRQVCLDLVEVRRDLGHRACPHLHVRELIQRRAQGSRVGAQSRSPAAW